MKSKKIKSYIKKSKRVFGKSLKYTQSHLKEIFSIVVIFAFLLTTLSGPYVNAATYYFSQGDWSGGVSAGTANHTSNQSGWNNFSAADSDINAGTDIHMNLPEASWEVSNLPANLYDIKDFGSGNIISIGGLSKSYDPGVLSSNDSGQDWSFTTGSSNRALFGGFIFDQNTYWQVGDYGQVIKSTDGGSSWSANLNNSGSGASDFYDIYFTDANTGWAVGLSSKIIKTTDGGSNWTEQTAGISAHFYSVYFIDSNTGWAIGASGKILKTTDGGANWTAQTSGTTRSLRDIYFIDSNTGWAVGDYGTLLRTTNGGANWTAQTNGSVSFNGVYFIDANTGWAVGDGGIILKTVNGGVTWVSQDSPAVSNLNSIYFTDSNTGWAGGSGGTIIKTTDGGSTWTILRGGVRTTFIRSDIISPSEVFAATTDAVYKTSDLGKSWQPLIEGYYLSVDMVDSNTGWAGGSGGTIIKTTDGGSNWTTQTTNVNTPIRDIYFVNSTTGWAVGDSGVILNTTNGGSTWTAQTSGTVEYISRVHFIDSNTGWVVGGNGTILNTTNGGSTWTAQTSGITEFLNSLYFVNSTTGWAIGTSGKIIKTTNGGSTWTVQTSGTSNQLLDVNFTNSTTGWVVGYSGSILKTTDGGANWANETVPNNGYNLAVYNISVIGNTAVALGESGLTLNKVSSYSSLQTLTSSPYDAEDTANIIAGISWSETKPSGTDVKFQIRTAPDSSGSPGAWSSWMGPSGTSADYFTDPAGGESIPSALGDGVGDRWFQYKVYLTSDGSNTPAVDDVVLTYVVNATPEFNPDYPDTGGTGVSATQISDSNDADRGKVKIYYSVRDGDTSVGSNTPGYVTPSFEYNIGAGWVAISEGNLAVGDTSNKSVDPTTFVTYSATWDAKTQIPESYSANALIRVTINDNEAANNTVQAVTSAFTLDTTNPSISAWSLNSGTDVLTLTASDNSNIDYRLANEADFSGAGSWVIASSTSVNTTINDWTITGNPNKETVHVQVTDIYGNTSTAEASAPATPQNFDLRDISNAVTEDWREFLSWRVYTSEEEATFSRYEIYRSTDNTNFVLINTISDINLNYYTDTSVTGSNTYYYKIAILDTDGDRSNYSSVTSDTPDGQGGTDFTPPSISGVSVDDVQTTWAKIIWTTDEISTSKIHYGTSTSYGSTVESTSLVTDHSLTITGLSSDTTYYFKVVSVDILNNQASNDNFGAGYTFTTAGGPVISAVAVTSVNDSSAKITWNTDREANSYVVYSTNVGSLGSGNGTTVGSANLVSDSPYQHKVTLTGLNAHTTYYFYVKSAGGDGGYESIDNNSNQYYTFNTTFDQKPPVISGVAVPIIAPTAASIIWLTDELADTLVNYGTVEGLYTRSSSLDSTLSIYHVVSITNLSPETTYYFEVKSNDANGYQSAETSSFRTASALETVSVGSSIDAALDTTEPTISNVEIIEVGSFGATIEFTTDELTTAFINFGEKENYGKTVGSSSFKEKHQIKLFGLKAGTTYNFEVKAVDKAGNITALPNDSFQTNFVAENLDELVKLENAEQFQEQLEDLIESTLPSLIPPVISEVEVGSITNNSAIISWKTNINTFGSVALSNLPGFSPESQEYDYEVSDTSEKTREHNLNVKGLEAGSRYNFQVRSFSIPGVVGKSKNYTFATKALGVNASAANITTNSFIVSWLTDFQTTSFVEYRNTTTGEIGQTGDRNLVKNHVIEVENLDSDTTYAVKVFGYDSSDVLVESGGFNVTTLNDAEPPIISNISISSAFIPYRPNQLQTIISWQTDERANSRILYEEGVGSGENLSQSVDVPDEFITEHVLVVPGFKPGTVYRLKIESEDETGNIRSTPVRTIITPTESGSVFEVIIKNFEESFGFLKNIRR